MNPRGYEWKHLLYKICFSILKYCDQHTRSIKVIFILTLETHSSLCTCVGVFLCTKTIYVMLLPQ